MVTNNIQERESAKKHKAINTFFSCRDTFKILYQSFENDKTFDYSSIECYKNLV